MGATRPGALRQWAELSRARGTLADLFSGWGAVIFAAALAGFLTAFLSVHAGLYTALVWALGGAAYGLITGWIIALAQMGTRRPLKSARANR